jgi:hypothetical protein
MLKTLGPTLKMGAPQYQSPGATATFGLRPQSYAPGRQDERRDGG